jgi:7-carboxy-7-deazaguanine synthase
MKDEIINNDGKKETKSKSVFRKVRDFFSRDKSNTAKTVSTEQIEKKKKNKKKKDKGKKKKDKTIEVTLTTDSVSSAYKEQKTVSPKTEDKKNQTVNDDEKKDLNITEIFYSIQGESTFAGLPCVFIRLQGCNLRCSWCDTKHALNVKKERKRMNIDQILEKVKKYECKNICVTGGEPLMQKKVPELLSVLCNNGFTVALETNGFYSLKEIDKRVSKIVDFKCPGSKMEKKNNFDNIEYFTRKDEVKFVIKDKEDYNWAKKIILKHQLADKVNSVLLSPVFGKLEPKQLSKWMTKDNLNARLQLQIHKYIWNPKKKGV